MARNRGYKSETFDPKIVKRRLRSLERENQRLRKELRKKETLEVLDEEVLESTWEPKEQPRETPRCVCGSKNTGILEIPLRDGVRKYLMCSDCPARKRIV